MANTIKWSGIEQWKYGLTARWYVSAYYGNDIDVDGVGYYNPSTNPTGHGGPTRPFASLSKLQQDAAIVANSIIVVDAGSYVSLINHTKILRFVGDGIVVFNGLTSSNDLFFYNIKLIQCTFDANKASSCIDTVAVYCQNIGYYGAGVFLNSVFVESKISGSAFFIGGVNKCTFIRCGGTLFSAESQPHLSSNNNTIINSPNLTLFTNASRPAGLVCDYSIIIGTVKSNRPINGKTTGVTVEDFKIDGNYFVKSYSEVDLFGNPSGSGATVPQLQTLFNNYFSPVYLDTWQDLDLSLKPTASNMIKFGGLNGTYIGALPVGHYFSGETLWNTYKDAINTSNIDYDILSKGLVVTAGQEFGTFRSTRISLGAPYILEPINFFANLVYNSDGTPRQGVSNQRIDTTPDDLPDNTKNQRVVYDFMLQYSETVGGALTPFLNFELNRTPAVDNSGRSNLDAAFVALERKKIKVADFIIELTLRRIIIE